MVSYSSQGITGQAGGGLCKPPRICFPRLSLSLILAVLSGACTSVALFCRALAVLLLTLFIAKKQILVLLLGRCFSTALSSSPCGTACLLLVSPPHSRDCAGIHSKHLLEEVDYLCILNGMQVQFHANSSVKDASKN